ncbi:MAG: hypothetical protein K9L32_10200 [Chromatiaceae bacterium]|nr:hypothetical protein [Chromatiaceae bacterium]
MRTGRARQIARDLEQSRAYWKGRALAAEEQDAKSDTAAKTLVFSTVAMGVLPLTLFS